MATEFVISPYGFMSYSRFLLSVTSYDNSCYFSNLLLGDMAILFP